MTSLDLHQPVTVNNDIQRTMFSQPSEIIKTEPNLDQTLIKSEGRKRRAAYSKPEKP
jgi:hypothetical protein